MKKLLYIFTLISSFLLAGCTSETENLFGESASNRVEEAMENARKILVEAPNGWLMKYYPSSQQSFGGYNVLMSFTAEGEVTVSADIADPGAKSTSLYRLKEQAGPTLTVDTYNEIFHFFSDPASGVGATGLGMEGDYEFTIQSATPEQVVLKGKKTGNIITMTPMPENETWEAYLTDIEEAEQKVNYVLFSYAADGEKYDVTKSYRTLAISHEVDGENVTEVFSYIQTKEGMEFYSPITLGGMEVSKLVYDSASGTWKSEDGKAVLSGETTPPALLFANGGPWFVTYDGMSSYGQQTVASTLQGMASSYPGKTLDYLAIAPTYELVDMVFGGREGVLQLVTSASGDDKVSLTLTGYGDEIGGEFANAGILDAIFLFAKFSPVTFTVEPDDPVNPTKMTLTQVGNTKNVIVVTNQETPFGYHE